jgi:3-(3-hydroxy-phenyl)propionate hydroxylase
MQGKSKRNEAVTEHAVVIAGGGPTGLMLAAELALARVDVAIVERRACHDLDGLRAGGLHIRTIELFDQRGIAERFISQGQKHTQVPFARTALDGSDLPTRHPYYLALWQPHIERILADWLAELEVPIYRGREVTSFAQNASGVDVELSDGRRMCAQYLVGCDGGRSKVRKQAGIDFPGWDATTSYLIAEIETTEEPVWGMRSGENGMDAAIGKLGAGRARTVLVERHTGKNEAPTLGDVGEALRAVYGTDFGLRSADYISRFTDMARQAAAYRDRRVLLAGDAAHVHSPMGGQGLNLGVQDAVNLGWKLAQVIRESAPDSLLDSYHAERHPVGARVLRTTMALTALERGDARIDALRELIVELTQLDQTRTYYVARTSGLDIHYDLGEGHPLLGRRMPDLDIVTATGAQRVYTLLHEARPVLLNFSRRAAIASTPWLERVQLVHADFDGSWELPVIGRVAAPSAVLVRPDGYVVWVGEGSEDGLQHALGKWFGPPKA